ncbi:hypothetical protein ACHWQZ_G010237 [Mnemiopsis leidyi]
MGDEERRPIVDHQITPQSSYNTADTSENVTESTVRAAPQNEGLTTDQAAPVASQPPPQASQPLPQSAPQTSAQPTGQPSGPPPHNQYQRPRQDSRYQMGGYQANEPAPPIDDRPLPTRTRMGQPAQTGIAPPGLIDINYALDTAVYSKYHSFLLAAGSLAQVGAGSQVFLTCVIQAYANCKFDLSSSERSWLLCSIFLLYPFGACFLGWTADKWGRKWSLVISLYLVLITGIIQVLASAWWVLFIARLLMGFFLPGVMNIPLIFWLEVSAYNHREEGMLAFLCLFASGAVYDFSLAAIFSSVSENYAYEFICALAVLPIVIAVVFAHLTQEGPRWLGVGSTLKEADIALREYGYQPENPQVTTPIDIYYVHMRGNICLVFKYLCCAISLFATLLFCNFYIEYGIIVILPYMFYWDYCGMGFRENTHDNQLWKEITDFFTGQKCEEISTYSFLYLLAIAACIVIGLLVGYFTQQYFGSRVTLITYSIISCIILAFLDVCWSYVLTIIELVCGMVFLTATQYSLWSSVLIQSPTFMRASGVGYADAWGKVGALCAIALSSQMGDRYLLDVVFWTFLAVGILQIFFICLVSLEAKGSRVYDNLPSDPRANEPPPLCLPPGPPPPPPPPPPPQYYPHPNDRPYYY